MEGSNVSISISSDTFSVGGNLVDGGPCWFALTSTDCPTSEAIGSVDRIYHRCAEQTKRCVDAGRRTRGGGRGVAGGVLCGEII